MCSLGKFSLAEAIAAPTDGGTKPLAEIGSLGITGLPENIVMDSVNTK